MEYRVSDATYACERESFAAFSPATWMIAGAFPTLSDPLSPTARKKLERSGGPMRLSPVRSPGSICIVRYDDVLWVKGKGREDRLHERRSAAERDGDGEDGEDGGGEAKRVHDYSAELTKERRGWIGRRISAPYIPSYEMRRKRTWMHSWRRITCIPPPPPCLVDVYVWDGSRLKRVACTSIGFA